MIYGAIVRLRKDQGNLTAIIIGMLWRTLVQGPGMRSWLPSYLSAAREDMSGKVDTASWHMGIARHESLELGPRIQIE